MGKKFTCSQCGSEDVRVDKSREYGKSYLTCLDCGFSCEVKDYPFVDIRHHL